MPFVSPARRLRASLRGETALVLPLATALVITLSLAALFFYRSAVAEIRRAEHQRLLASAQRHLARQSNLDTRLDLPEDATAIARLAPDGIATWSSRGWDGVNLLPDPVTRRLEARPGVATVAGPGGAFGDSIAVFVPLSGARGELVRLDWNASVLARHERRFPILAATVVIADLVLLGLVLVYRRRRLQPIEGLIERARSVRDPGDSATSSSDEVAQLVGTFERALEELETREQNDPLSQAIRESSSREDPAGPTTGLMLLDAGGQVLALNEAGAFWLATEPDVAGRSLHELLAHQPELLTVLSGAVERRESVRRQECTIETPEGNRVLGLTLTRLANADGSLRGWLGLFTDLTSVQREHRELQLSRSLAQIAEMSAGLAHELRNGMASLRGYTKRLERSQLDDRQRDDVIELRQEVDHLHRVAEDFLSFARPGTARSQTFDLLEVARKASRDPALEGHPIELEVASAVAPTDVEDRPAILLEGDPQLVERALRNLLHNAVRAQRDRVAASESDSEPVAVRLTPASRGSQDSDAADGPILEVLDRGPGIDAATRERLFTPFASGHADGVGLGLALSRRIADLHGAELVLEDRDGGGTRAILRFPA